MAAGNSTGSDTIKRQVWDAFAATLASEVLQDFAEEITDEDFAKMAAEDDSLVEHYRGGEFQKIDGFVIAALVLKRLLADHPRSSLGKLPLPVSIAQVSTMLNMELSDYGDFGGELENVWLLDVAGDLNETVEDWDSLPVPGDDDETP